MALTEAGEAAALMEVTPDGGERRADGEAEEGEATVVGDVTALPALLRGDMDAKADAKNGIAPAL